MDTIVSVLKTMEVPDDSVLAGRNDKDSVTSKSATATVRKSAEEVESAKQSLRAGYRLINQLAHADGETFGRRGGVNAVITLASSAGAKDAECAAAALSSLDRAVKCSAEAATALSSARTAKTIIALMQSAEKAKQATLASPKLNPRSVVKSTQGRCSVGEAAARFCVWCRVVLHAACKCCVCMYVFVCPSV
jgi:hypothetical protein